MYDRYPKTDTDTDTDADAKKSPIPMPIPIPILEFRIPTYDFVFQQVSVLKVDNG